MAGMMDRESMRVMDNLHRMYLHQSQEDKKGAEHHIDLKASDILFIQPDEAKALHEEYHRSLKEHPIISLYGNSEKGVFPLILVIGQEPNDDRQMGDDVGLYDFRKAPHCGVWNTAYKLVATRRNMSIKSLKELCEERGSSMLAFADVSPFTIPYGARDKTEIRAKYTAKDYVRHVQRIMSKDTFARVQMVILSGLEHPRYSDAMHVVEKECIRQKKVLVRSAFFSMNRKGGYYKVEGYFSLRELDLLGNIFDSWSRKWQQRHNGSMITPTKLDLGEYDYAESVEPVSRIETVPSGGLEWSKEVIIEPRKDRDFESLQTFNTAAILIDGEVHFVYRAIGKDLVSRFGYARSRDGVHLDERLDHPLYQYSLEGPSYYSYVSGGSLGGIEDPRIVRLGDTAYVTYTVADSSGLRVALTSLSIGDFLEKKWDRATVKALSPRSETNKNWVLFPEMIGGKYALLHSITPKIMIDYFDDLDFEGASFVKSYHNGTLSGHWGEGWEGLVRGVGPPPLKTDRGWLTFYHALPRGNPDAYCIGAMLLDANDPSVVLCWAKEPVITPWDIGEVLKQNIVYSCGAVIKDGRLFLYFGAGDTKIHVAHTDSGEFLNRLVSRSERGS